MSSMCFFVVVVFLFLVYLGFLSRTPMIHRTAGEAGGYLYLFSSSLSLPPASQTLRHYPGDYRRELTSARSQKPDSYREPMVSERKSLTAKLHVLIYMSSVCLSYLLVCHPYDTRMLLVCTPMPYVCHSCVLDVIRMSLVCGFTMNRYLWHL